MREPPFFGLPFINELSRNLENSVGLLAAISHARRIKGGSG